MSSRSRLRNFDVNARPSRELMVELKQARPVLLVMLVLLVLVLAVNLLPQAISGWIVMIGMVVLTVTACVDRGWRWDDWKRP